jgi:hypothetical protein
MSANDGGAPASVGNDAAPLLLYVPCRSGQPSGVGIDFIEAQSVGYGGFPELVAHPNCASRIHNTQKADGFIFTVIFLITE